MAFYFLKANALGFDEKKQHHKKLRQHHRCPEYKRNGQAMRTACNNRGIDCGRRRAQTPMSEAAQSNALAANFVWKNFAYVRPNNGSLRERKEENKKGNAPRKQFNKFSCPGNVGGHQKRNSRSPRTNEQQLFSSHFVNGKKCNAHRENIRRANNDRLKLPSKRCADDVQGVVEIVEITVYKRKLIERRHAYS